MTGREIQTYSNGEFQIDLIPDPDSDGFLVEAGQLARALSYHSVRELLRSLPEDECSTALVPGPLNSDKRVHYVTEAGFFRAIGMRQPGRIKDPQVRGSVERFQDYTFKVIVPSWRRGKGPQDVAPVPPQRQEIDWANVDRRAAAMAILAAEDAREAAEARAEQIHRELRVASPKADAWDAIVNTGADYSMARAAKMLARDPAIAVMRIGRNDLFRILGSWKWIYRDGRYEDSPWTCYQTAVNTGRLAEKPQFRKRSTGEWEPTAPQVMVTFKGLSDIRARLLAEAGQLAIEGASTPGGAA